MCAVMTNIVWGADVSPTDVSPTNFFTLSRFGDTGRTFRRRIFGRFADNPSDVSPTNSYIVWLFKWLVLKPLGVPDERVMPFLLIWNATLLDRY